MPADSSHHTGQSVGMRLRLARLAKKYTQQQLARPDFSVSYISAIERGQIQPSLRALEILAQRLDLSTTDLLPERPSFEGVASSESGNAPPGSVEWELLLLEAQIAIHQKNPERALQIAQSLLPQKGERRQEKTSLVYYVLGWAYLEAERLEESEQMLAEAARLARDGADPLYPCILSLQCAVYTAMHNVEQAAQLQQESQRLLTRPPEITPNVVFLAHLHANLAQQQSSLGELKQASVQFQQALALLMQHNPCQRNQEDYYQLFTAYRARELSTLALLYGYKWLIAHFYCQLPGLKGDVTYALGRILLRSHPAEAREYLSRIIQEAETRQDQLALAGARVLLASWLTTQGELKAAEDMLNLTQAAGAAFAETLMYADAQLLAGELAYRRQDYNVGDRCFEEGLALFEKMGAKEDLIEHFARYAQLLEERDSIQKSLYYWKLAFEQREKSHMPML